MTDIPAIIAAARRDARCVRAVELRALCDEIDRLRGELERAQQQNAGLAVSEKARRLQIDSLQEEKEAMERIAADIEEAPEWARRVDAISIHQQSEFLATVARMTQEQKALGLPVEVLADRISSGILSLATGGMLAEAIILATADDLRLARLGLGRLAAFNEPAGRPASLPVGNVSRTAIAMLDAGGEFVPGEDSSDSSIHPFVQQLAVEHAFWMAEHRIQNHAGFNARFERVLAEFGMSVKCSEIVAQSWPWESTVKEAAPSPWKAWKYSPGHWSVASVPHRFIGAEMLQGRNGIWYAVILAVD